jgi:hypothetical protein
MARDSPTPNGPARPEKGRFLHKMRTFPATISGFPAAFPRCTLESPLAHPLAGDLGPDHDQTTRHLVTMPDVDLTGAVPPIKRGKGDKDRNVHSRNDRRRWPRRRGYH